MMCGNREGAFAENLFPGMIRAVVSAAVRFHSPPPQLVSANARRTPHRSPNPPPPPSDQNPGQCACTGLSLDPYRVQAPGRYADNSIPAPRPPSRRLWAFTRPTRSARRSSFQFNPVRAQSPRLLAEKTPPQRRGLECGFTRRHLSGSRCDYRQLMFVLNRLLEHGILS
jgi:hypothetical protein